jgi:hypothetical protein
LGQRRFSDSSPSWKISSVSAKAPKPYLSFVSPVHKDLMHSYSGPLRVCGLSLQMMCLCDDHSWCLIRWFDMFPHFLHGSSNIFFWCITGKPDLHFCSLSAFLCKSWSVFFELFQCSCWIHLINFLLYYWSDLITLYWGWRGKYMNWLKENWNIEPEEGRMKDWCVY